MQILIIHPYIVRFVLLVFIYLFLISPANSLDQWQKIEAKGYLTWVTRPSPLTYYTSLDGVIGLEYDILKQFCDVNGLELVVVTAASNKELFNMFDGFNIDIAGANLTLTDERVKKYSASLAYDETYISLVSSYRQPKITSMERLKNLSGMIINNSSYEIIADDLVKNYGTKISRLDDGGLYELLQMVAAGSIDFTLSDSNIIPIYGVYIPQLRVGKQLSDVHEIVFYMRKGKDSLLQTKLDDFIEKYIFQNKVNRYKQFIIDTLPNSKPADTVNFLKNYKNRWPKVKPIIYATARKFNISPILLGAISYQESHWNAKAVSPTLVKGLMMLTKAVASEQDVTDRFNPLQSLEGGVRHFLKMRKRVPARINEPDKTNFALAAYNLGYGHLEKARVMTQKAGKNPDLWSDVKLFLPRLNNLEKNRADGKTAVRYVENIHVYQNLLQWKEQQ